MIFCELFNVRIISDIDFSVVKNIPFDSEKKFSAALLSVENSRRLFVKGAPEKLISASCSYLDKNGKAQYKKGKK